MQRSLRRPGEPSGRRSGLEQRVSEPMSLGDGLRRLVAELGIGPKLEEQRAVALWPTVVSELLGQSSVGRSRVEGIKQGALHVKVEQAAWRHRFMLDRDRIRDRLNGLIGGEAVRIIRFGG